MYTVLLLMLGSGDLSEYYSEKGNYEKLTVTVETIELNDEQDMIYFNVGYCILGDNISIVLNNNIEELKQGDVLSIYSAPGYFGDGYLYPIVGIEKNEKIYLNFDTGVENQVKYQEQSFQDYSNILIKSIIIFGFSSISFTIILLLNRRKVQKLDTYS